jgi:hypothetical protein
MSYKIIRFYRNPDRKRTIETGLTLEQAQFLISFSLSSSTCTEDEEQVPIIAATRWQGGSMSSDENNPEKAEAWFDGYEIDLGNPQQNEE